MSHNSRSCNLLWKKLSCCAPVQNSVYRRVFLSPIPWMGTARWGEKKELLKTKCLFMGLVGSWLLARDGGRRYHMGHNLDCKPCLGRSRARLHLVEKNDFLTLGHWPVFVCLKQLWLRTYLQKCMHSCMPPSVKAHKDFPLCYIN